MDKETLKKAIEDKLDTIREQFEIIRQHESKIPSIELDLIMDNLRQLYEYFLILDRENLPEIPFSLEKEYGEKPEAFSPIEHTEENTVERADPIADGTELPEEDQEDMLHDTLVREEGKDNLDEENTPGEEINEAREVTEDEKTSQPGMQYRENSSPRSTYDLFNEPQSTVADKLKNHDEPRVADKLKQNHLEDVRKGIGINEKFRFINDLFDGNIKGYEDIINRVNECKTYGEAFILIDEMKSNLNWTEADESVKTFMDIIKRRF